MFLAGDIETVTVLRDAGRDKLGDPIGPTTEIPLYGCLFAPGPSKEMEDAANQVDSDATVYAPAGADVRSTDRIRARGVVYQVVGDALVWSAAGVVIVLRRVTG